MSRPIRNIPPCPPGFSERFIANGWRGVERVYGASTQLLLKWWSRLHRARRQLQARLWEIAKDHGIVTAGSKGAQ